MTKLKIWSSVYIWIRWPLELNSYSYIPTSKKIDLTEELLLEFICENEDRFYDFLVEKYGN
jgi:hypothetical protein